MKLDGSFSQSLLEPIASYLFFIDSILPVVEEPAQEARGYSIAKVLRYASR
jgi:hypothetical protein